MNWFPTNERVMACGFVMASLNTGIAIPFLVGPLLVPEPDANVTMAVYGKLLLYFLWRGIAIPLYSPLVSTAACHL